MKPKKGDIIRITHGLLPFCRAGDIAIIIESDDGDHQWKANFNSCGNKKVYKDGIWFVNTHMFRIIENNDNCNRIL